MTSWGAVWQRGPSPRRETLLLQRFKCFQCPAQPPTAQGCHLPVLRHPLLAATLPSPGPGPGPAAGLCALTPSQQPPLFCDGLLPWGLLPWGLLPRGLLPRAVSSRPIPVTRVSGRAVSKAECRSTTWVGHMSLPVSRHGRGTWGVTSESLPRLSWAPVGTAGRGHALLLHGGSPRAAPFPWPPVVPTVWFSSSIQSLLGEGFPQTGPRTPGGSRAALLGRTPARPCPGDVYLPPSAHAPSRAFLHHSLIHSFTCSFVHSSRSFVNSVIIHSLSSFIHSFTCSFIHSLPPSLAEPALGSDTKRGCHREQSQR